MIESQWSQNNLCWGRGSGLVLSSDKHIEQQFGSFATCVSRQLLQWDESCCGVILEKIEFAFFCSGVSIHVGLFIGSLTTFHIGIRKSSTIFWAQQFSWHVQLSIWLKILRNSRQFSTLHVSLEHWIACIKVCCAVFLCDIVLMKTKRIYYFSLNEIVFKTFWIDSKSLCFLTMLDMAMTKLTMKTTTNSELFQSLSFNQQSMDSTVFVPERLFWGLPFWTN